MNSGLLVRSDIRLGDIGPFTGLYGLLYAREHGWDPTFEAYVAQTLAKLVLAPEPERNRLWLLEDQGRIVGSVGIVERDNREAQLRWLLLHPDYRGLGWGRRLVDGTLTFCREQGHTSVYLWTVKDLVAAASLYRAAGFCKTGEITHQIWGRTVTEERYDLEIADLC